MLMTVFSPSSDLRFVGMSSFPALPSGGGGVLLCCGSSVFTSFGGELHPGELGDGLKM